MFGTFIYILLVPLAFPALLITTASCHTSSVPFCLHHSVLVLTLGNMFLDDFASVVFFVTQLLNLLFLASKFLTSSITPYLVVYFRCLELQLHHHFQHLPPPHRKPPRLHLFDYHQHCPLRPQLLQH